MIIIGLVGRIGAGKSTVASRFAAHGAHVVDADRLAHEVLGEEDVVSQVAARFGTGVLDAAGRIHRRAVADRVFGPTPAHTEALEWLESLVHPRVRERIAARLAAVRAEDEKTREQGGPAAVVVLDVPLLVQAGWADVCDRLVMVHCADGVRRQRLADRRWSPAERSAREAAWERKYTAPTLPPEKIATVDTSGDLAYTQMQVDLIWSGLSS